MNFARLTRLFAERGTDRAAIAEALRMPLALIDQWQLEAERMAAELNPQTSIANTGGPKSF